MAKWRWLCFLAFSCLLLRLSSFGNGPVKKSWPTAGRVVWWEWRMVNDDRELDQRRWLIRAISPALQPRHCARIALATEAANEPLKWHAHSVKSPLERVLASSCF